MKFSYSAIWDDSVRLLKAHGSLIVAVAGVFLLLPEVFTSYFFPWPEAKSAEELMRLAPAYATDNWPVLLIGGLVTAAGAVTILLLLFDRGTLTVGGAIRAAVPLLISYVVVSFITNLLTFCGMLLFVLPGLYLLGRTTTVGAVMVAENRRNPLDALQRGFEMTKGRGWAIFGLIAIIFVTGWLVIFAVSRVVGSILVLVAGQRLGNLLAIILDSGLAAVLHVVILVVTVAIYRWLTAAPAQPGVPRSTGI